MSPSQQTGLLDRTVMGGRAADRAGRRAPSGGGVGGAQLSFLLSLSLSLSLSLYVRMLASLAQPALVLRRRSLVHVCLRAYVSVDGWVWA